MQCTPTYLSLILPALVAGLTGCEAPAPTTRTFSHLTLPETSRAVAYEAALVVMRERYPIDSSDRENAEITSEAIESHERAASGRVGDVLGVPRRMRRVVSTRVTGTEHTAEVWCKIVVQRQDTDAAQMFASDRAMQDAPTLTAADRDGATTDEQNEVWQTTHRDKQEERTVLRSIEEMVVGPRTPGGARVDSEEYAP
jgi:hypothetical protein